MPRKSFTRGIWLMSVWHIFMSLFLHLCLNLALNDICQKGNCIPSKKSSNTEIEKWFPRRRTTDSYALNSNDNHRVHAWNETWHQRHGQDRVVAMVCSQPPNGSVFDSLMSAACHVWAFLSGYPITHTLTITTSVWIHWETLWLNVSIAVTSIEAKSIVEAFKVVTTEQKVLIVRLVG